MPLIDIHAHMVPKQFPADPAGGSNARWPCMQCHPTDPSQATVIIGGKPFRAIDDRCWNTERRLESMGLDGIDAQALSPMPELLSYWFSAEDTIVMGRHIAEAIGGMMAKAPKHFYGLGMAPLQNPDKAAEELLVLKRDFGMCGVEIGTNVLGKNLGDPEFRVFFAAAEELGMAVFIHPLNPLGQDRWGSVPALAPIAAFPMDTALAAASLVYAKVMQAHPKLRLAFSHGGGAAMTVLNRMQQIWNSAPEMLHPLPEAPLTTARRFYYDTLVYEPALLRALRDMFGADRLIIGTDDPFAIRQQKPAAFVRSCGLAESEIAAVLGGNARNFLGIANHA